MSLEQEALKLMLEAIIARASHLGPGQYHLALSKSSSIKDKLSSLVSTQDSADIRDLLNEVLELAQLFRT